MIKMWDLSNTTCVRTFTHHKDKVQVIQWNPLEAPLLASGGFDSFLHLTDVRMADSVNLIFIRANLY